MNCQEANHLLDAEVLTSSQHGSVQQHLATCHVCREQWDAWREVAAWSVPQMPASLRERVEGALPMRAAPHRPPFRPYLVTGLFVMTAAAAAALVVQQVRHHEEVTVQADTGNAITVRPAPVPAPEQPSAAPVVAVEAPVPAAPPPPVALPVSEPVAPVQEIAAATAEKAPSEQDTAVVATTADSTAETYVDWPAIEAMVLDAANNRLAGLTMLSEWSRLGRACPHFTRSMPQTRLADTCPELNNVLWSRDPVEFWSACQRRTRTYNKLATRFAQAKPAVFTDRARVERALSGTYLLLSDYCRADTYPQRFPKVVDIIRRAEALDGIVLNSETLMR